MRENPSFFNDPNAKKLHIIDHFKRNKTKSLRHCNSITQSYNGTPNGEQVLVGIQSAFASRRHDDSATIAKATSDFINNKHVISIDKAYCPGVTIDTMEEFAKRGERHYILTGHTNIINALCFSDDAKRLVSCSADGSIRLWDLMTRSCIAQLEGIEFPLLSGRFSAVTYPQAAFFEITAQDPHCVARITCVDENTFHIEQLNGSVKALVYATDKEWQSYRQTLTLEHEQFTLQKHSEKRCNMM